MLNAFEAAAKAKPLIDQLGALSPDHAWERIHVEFNARQSTEARLMGLVMARWVLSRLTAPKHHKGLVSIVSVLAAIRRDADLHAVWMSDQLSQVMAELAA